jgi:hypothetical protein
MAQQFLHVDTTKQSHEKFVKNNIDFFKHYKQYITLTIQQAPGIHEPVLQYQAGQTKGYDDN